MFKKLISRLFLRSKKSNQADLFYFENTKNNTEKEDEDKSKAVNQFVGNKTPNTIDFTST